MSETKAEYTTQREENMFAAYINQYGVQVEVQKADPRQVRVFAGESVFYCGDCRDLALALADLAPIALNPALLTFMQWFDEEGKGAY